MYKQNIQMRLLTDPLPFDVRELSTIITGGGQVEIGGTVIFFGELRKGATFLNVHRGGGPQICMSILWDDITMGGGVYY